MSGSSQPTRAPQLAEQVARQLTRSIHSGEWRQGQRLPTEAALGERFGISRSVVREAISMLRNAGLVTSRRGSGSFVTESPTVALHMPLPSASLSSVIRLLELRRALEVEAARLAATRRTPAQLRRIRNAVIEIDEAVEAGEAGVDQDMAFHRSIAEACGNEHFTAVIDFYNRFLHHAITLTRTNEARRTVFMTQVMAEHDDIVEAIGRGDAEAAARAVCRHLDNAEWRLSQAPADLLEQVGPPAPPNPEQ
ncbi:GntR family transcriptional regulator [Kushneria sinocarnis]|uniref:GntR family transcriptional regulator n=1 Tax=Kushneria sinocarnis TaxID=595502 RepID=A0A420WUB4_9GAMM|nr:FadR/GntR family transcriptional regulator [Kushneria sinocarnis]RKQ97036.1 GntR family transcriptional regulator [Kushneria sinocarnis]